MKNDRQTAVLQIIEETAVETQEQLMQLLAERGFACTQATVSRDIKQLHLIKAPDGKGGRIPLRSVGADAEAEL